MKSYLVIAILVTTFFITSCGDIIDSDINISKTEITFGNVLANQESNVILPLKDGNVWYYNVANYDDNGELIYISYDSIKVNGRIQFVGEDIIWYDVYFPFVQKSLPTPLKTVFMINTDKGLLIRCDECETKKFLWAKYPEINNLFPSHERIFKIVDSNGMILQIDTSIVSKSGTDKQTILNMDLGYVETIKYQTWKMSGKPLDKEREFMEENYLKDFGLVRTKFYSLTNSTIRSEYEYVKSVPTGDNCKNNPVIQVGKISSGTRIFNSITLTNNFSQKIIVNNSDLSIENDPNVNFTIISNVLPFNLSSSGEIKLDYTFSPLKSGKFTVVVNIKCNYGCWYKITFEGECL